ncbi:MAG: hypothetical protein AAF490_10900 [Chloroflexota bacterium]
MYRELDPAKTLKTIEKLQNRINERFPDSSLAKVCQELKEVASTSQQKAEWIQKPNIPLRIGIGFLIALGVAGLIFTFTRLNLSIGQIGLAEFAQLLEASVNDLLLIGAAFFFLTNIETRIKRARALEDLHELRAVAHVIDMHQLTKDPSRITGAEMGIMTPSSPRSNLTVYELTRYLDYCSEMLSLTGKIAALYAQYLPDAIVLDMVNDIETLTSGLSRKIWQKIIILQRLITKETENNSLQF